MNGEIYKIEIPVEVHDKTDPGLSTAQKKVTQFEKSLEKTQARAQKMNRQKINLIIDAVDKATAILGRVTTAAKRLVFAPFRMTISVIDRATAPIRSLFNYATSLRGIITGIAMGFAGRKLIGDPIGLADMMEGSQIGFETLFKSREKAVKMMTDIKNFAIATPFSTKGVISQTQRMMAYGWNPEDIIKDMRTIGNAAAGTGKGEEGMQRIILALGQIRMKGKVSAEEMNQLAEAGVRAREYVAKGLGVSMPQAIKMMENGAVDANKAVQMILKGMSEFDGLMESTASRTASGLLSQIKDMFEVSIVEKWGRGLQAGAILGMQRFNGWLNMNRASLEGMGETFKKMGRIISMNVVDKVTAVATRVNDVFKRIRETKEEVATMGGRFEVADNQARLLKDNLAFDDVKAAWDEIITQPLMEWWESTGKGKVDAIGKQIGNAIVDGIKQAMSDFMPQLMTDAAGAFNGNGGGDKGAGNAVNLGSAALLGWLGFKGVKGVYGAGKGMYNAYNGVRGFLGLGGVVAEGGAVAEGAAVAGLAGKAAGAAKAIPVLGNALAIIGGVGELLFAKNKAHAALKVGGGLGGMWGGAAAGAAIGSAVPILGTAAGGIIGGLAGYFGGRWAGDKAYNVGSKLLDKENYKNFETNIGRPIGQQFKIDGLTVNPVFNINSTATPEEIIDKMRDMGTEWGNAFAESIAIALEKTYVNMPKKQYSGALGEV